MSTTDVRRSHPLFGTAAALLALGACTRYIDANVLGTCLPGSTDPDCAPTPWPTSGHMTNSDPWLGTHNQVITMMNPKVLVLNFENGVTVTATTQTAQAEAAALAEGSRYHSYTNPPVPVPVFLQYQIVKVVDLTDNPPPAGWTNPSSTMVPTDPTGAFDPTALFSAQFADLYGFPDPNMPSRSLTLCELFDTGVVNELWIQDGEPKTLANGQANGRHAPYYQERKQTYDSNGAKVVGTFEPCAGGTGSGRSGCLDIVCDVTVRLAHLDPAVKPACGDEEVRGWGIEGMWAALPAYQTDAAAFLNRDFKKFGVQFDGWPELCDQATGTCVTYPDPDTATGMYANGTSWTIHPFAQGCGDTEFPSNAGSRYDYGSPGAPTNRVNSRCAHFGLRDGPNGDDAYEVYSYDSVAGEEATFPGCGGGWQEYWRQSMPGYGNTAVRSDGQPMGNWWPMLFY